MLYYIASISQFVNLLATNCFMSNGDSTEQRNVRDLLVLNLKKILHEILFFPWTQLYLCSAQFNPGLEMVVIKVINITITEHKTKPLG